MTKEWRASQVKGSQEAALCVLGPARPGWPERRGQRTAGPGPVGAGRQKDLPAPVEPDAGWVS